MSVGGVEVERAHNTKRGADRQIAVSQRAVTIGFRRTCQNAP